MEFCFQVKDPTKYNGNSFVVPVAPTATPWTSVAFSGPGATTGNANISMRQVYSDVAAVTNYAKKINTDEAIIKQSIAEYQPKPTMQTDEMKDLDGAMGDAVKLKFLDKVLTPDQVKEFIQIPPRS